MGFYPALTGKNQKDPERVRLQGVSKEFLHTMQCKVCPLNNQPGLKHPQMPATGSDKPLVYILGEAPGETEDIRGKQFVGRAGQVIRSRIPDEWIDYIRWNNVVRTRPPKNRTPTPIEVECCRPSVQADIERTRPVAIFGLGTTALNWATGRTGILRWNGRRMPVRVGSHVCWFYPMMHPSFVMRGQGWTDNELVFEKDLRRAFDEVDAGLPTPRVHDDPLSGIDFVSGARGNRDLSMVLDCINAMLKEEVIGVDYETRGLRPYENNAKMLSLALAGKQGSLAFPLYHAQSAWTDGQLQVIENAWYKLIMRGEGKLVAHNLGFELEWTGYFYGEETVLGGNWHDSMAQAFLLDERPDTHSLDFLTQQYFGFSIKSLTSTLRLNRKALHKEPLDEVLRYNAGDAKYHRQLFIKQQARLEDEGLANVYKHHLRRIPATVLTQLQGVPVHQPTVQKFYQQYTDKIEDVEELLAEHPDVIRFEKTYNRKFRPSSTADVAKYLASIGEHPDSVEEHVLVKIDNPVTNLVIKWRQANKVRSTYVLPLMKGSPTLFKDGRLHPIVSTTKTRTWRTSSEDPNSQNFPKRKLVEVRSQVRPGRNQKVVSIDYAQIQARNVAMESKDKALVQAFWDRYDIHADWTERIVRLYPRWIKEGAKQLAKDKNLFKTYRNLTKNQLVFPSFFGAQPQSISGYLGIPVDIAVQLHSDFWRMFPDIAKWHKRLQSEYRKNGYVSGLTGFRRRAPISPNQLINAPIQADESMIVLDAMARLCDAGFIPCMEIHDDLTFIWDKGDIERNLAEVVPLMIQVPFKWAQVVPIGVEVLVGDDWGSTKEIGAYQSDRWNGDLALKHDDPYVGSWADGTGWSGDD